MTEIVISTGSEDRNSTPEVTDVPKTLISVDGYSSDSESSSDDDEKLTAVTEERRPYAQEVLQPKKVGRQPRHCSALRRCDNLTRPQVVGRFSLGEVAGHS
uniref:Uncharacterized protein n=1 Tax=Sipha flava TaxID=143950 RepID=A0A2S2R1W8_9HEMI